MMYFNKDCGILSIITVNFVNIYMCLYTQGYMFLTMKTGIRVSGYPNCPDFGYPVPKIFENAQPCLLTNVKDL